MIVALGSVRGSPGVSVWSMLLAAAWPVESGLDRVVLEADCDGGVAGARYGVGVDPGVPGLVTGLRHSGDPTGPLTEVGRQLSPEAWLVPGPESAEVACRVWSADRAATSAAGSLAADRRRVWFCDLGRVSGADPTAAFVDAAAVTLVLCRDAAADLVQLPDRVDSVARSGGAVGVVVVGSPSYSLAELADFFGCGSVWVVPDGPSPIQVSQQVWAGSRRARRSPVWRSAVELAGEVALLVSPLPRLEASSGG